MLFNHYQWFIADFALISFTLLSVKSSTVINFTVINSTVINSTVINFIFSQHFKHLKLSTCLFLLKNDGLYKKLRFAKLGVTLARTRGLGRRSPAGRFLWRLSVAIELRSLSEFCERPLFVAPHDSGGPGETDAKFLLFGDLVHTHRTYLIGRVRLVGANGVLKIRYL